MNTEQERKLKVISYKKEKLQEYNKNLHLCPQLYALKIEATKESIIKLEKEFEDLGG